MAAEVNDQELVALDLAVARAEEKQAPFIHGVECFYVNSGGETFYSPTRDRAEAMRLMENYQLEVWPEQDPWGKYTGAWRAKARGDMHDSWPTPAIAICKAVIALKERANGR